MLVRITQVDNTLKLCPLCHYSGWRKSTRNAKYTLTEAEKTQQEADLAHAQWYISYEVLICDNCGYREERGHQKYHKTIFINGIAQCDVPMTYDHNKIYCLEHCAKRNICKDEKKQISTTTRMKVCI